MTTAHFPRWLLRLKLAHDTVSYETVLSGLLQTKFCFNKKLPFGYLLLSPRWPPAHQRTAVHTYLLACSLARLLACLLACLLALWCIVLLEKLTGLQLVKKFPAFHGTPRFITALIRVRHLSLSWASPIQSIYPHPTSWRSVLILSTHLRLGLPNCLLPSGFPTKNKLQYSFDKFNTQ